MKILGYTNVSLADILSSERMDGQKTSPATISRWVSGAQPIEPALRMYMKERLMRKLREEFKPRLAKAQVIAVGGSKGGSGSSAIAHALAVSAAELGYRTALYTYSEHCNNTYVRSGKTRQFLIAEPGAAIEAQDMDFVFVDVPSRFFIGGTPAVKVAALLDMCSLLLVPADLSCWMSVDVAKKVCEVLDEQPNRLPWYLLQSSRRFDFSVFRKEGAKELEPWIGLLLPEPIIHKNEPAEFEHTYRQWKFTSEHAQLIFYELLETICEKLDLSLYEGPPSEFSIKSMSLEDLVERFVV